MQSKWLACSSDRSTIHIFAVNANVDQEVKLTDEEAKIQPPEGEEEDPKDRPENKKSKLNFIKGILPKYFDSAWSYGRFKVPNEDNSLH